MRCSQQGLVALKRLDILVRMGAVQKHGIATHDEESLGSWTLQQFSYGLGRDLGLVVRQHVLR